MVEPLSLDDGNSQNGTPSLKWIGLGIEDSYALNSFTILPVCNVLFKYFRNDQDLNLLNNNQTL